jgi:hypothetical protein
MGSVAASSAVGESVMTLEQAASRFSSAQKDTLVAVLQDMTQRASVRIQEIDKVLADTVREIDRINRVREALSSEKERLQDLLDAVNKTMKDTDCDLELLLVRSVLATRLDALREKIAETRPDEMLKRKHDLVRERELLMEGQHIGLKISERLFGEGRHE